MNRMIRLTVLALALLPAFAFAQARPAATQYPEWGQLTPAQREALVAPLRERWNSNPDERARIDASSMFVSTPAPQRVLPLACLIWM